MRRSTRAIAVSFVAASFAACSDSTGPVNPTELSLDFCSADAPVFLAFMNEAGGWTAVAPDAGDTYRIPAMDKLGIAFVQQFSDGFATEVIYTTPEEIAPLVDVACTETAGSKTLNGAVDGVSPGSDAWITMSDQTVTVFPPPNTFTLTNLPNGSLDLVSNRDAFAVSSVVPDRIIIRRGLSLTSGATIPTLDFSSSEAVAPSANSLTVSGLDANESSSIDVRFSTATAVDHDLYYVPSFTSSPQAIYGVPASLTQSGDFHTLDVFAENAETSRYRGVLQFYRTAGDKTVALGPALDTPDFSTISASPFVRMRMTLPVQPQYNSLANAFYVQETSTRRNDVSVTGTAGYFDSPSTWTLDMPDLSTVSGFPSDAALQPGIGIAPSAQAYSGSAAVFFGGAPEENATLKYAGLDNPSAGRSAALRAGGRGTRVDLRAFWKERR